MTENFSEENTNPQAAGQPAQEAPDWRELRREEIESRRAERRASHPAWIGGVVLILVGVVFLLENMDALALGNWWALFILIPAIGAFVGAWTTYKNNDYHFTSGMGGTIIGGLVMVLVAFIFLFDMDWGKVWPLFIIAAGLGALTVGLLPR